MSSNPETAKPKRKRKRYPPMPVLILSQLNKFCRRGLITWPSICVQAFINALSVAAEAVGLSLLIPILKMIESDQSMEHLAETSRYWRVLRDFFVLFGIPQTLLSLLVMLFALVCLRQIIRHVQIMTISHLKQRVEKDLSLRLFNTALRSDPLLLQDVGAGRFTFIINNLAHESSIVLRTHAAYFNSLLLCAAYLSVAIPTAPGPTFIGIGFSLAVTAAMSFVAKHVRFVATKGVQVRQAFHNHLAERYRNWRIIKLGACVDRETEELRGWTRTIYDLDIATTRLSSLTDMMVVPIMSLLTLSILYFSVAVFAIKVSEIALLILVLIRLEPVVRGFSQLRQSMERFAPQLDQTLKDLDDFTRHAEPDGGERPFNGIAQGIEYRNVTMAYPSSGKVVLDGVSLTIPARKMTAIVGPSGGGKSTLVDILPRLLRPQSGQVLVDGVPTEEFRLDSLRAGIAFVSQRAMLFDTTILENIRYGLPHVSEEQAKEAARLAYADDFIRDLPEGYGARIGESGVRLSGGQQQRLALARAFASNAPIVVLDEPTSALDYESESKIKAAIDGIMARGQTTLVVIAHRLSTVATADQIVVMENGHVLDVGTPAELDQRGGWYKRMMDLHEGRGQTQGASATAASEHAR